MAFYENEQLCVCIIGDELTSGIGDTKSLGWTGRVFSRTELPPDTLLYTLPMASENSTNLFKRISTEVLPRFANGSTSDDENITIRPRLVVALSHHDIGEMTIARSRLNLANILDLASDHSIETLVIGPAPRGTADANEIQELSQVFAETCSRRAVQYVDLFTPLHKNAQWISETLASSNNYPGQVGYGLIAYLVLNSSWKEFLGV